MLCKLFNRIQQFIIRNNFFFFAIVFFVFFLDIHSGDIYVSSEKGLDILQCGARSVIPCKTLKYTVSYIAQSGDVILMLPTESENEKITDEDDAGHWIHAPILFSQTNLTIKAAEDAMISILSTLEDPIFILQSPPLNITKNNANIVDIITDASSYKVTFIKIRFQNLTLFDLSPSSLRSECYVNNITNRQQNRLIDLSFKGCELLEGFQIFTDQDVIDDEVNTIRSNTTSRNATTVSEEKGIHGNETFSKGKDSSNKTITNATSLQENGNFSNKTILELTPLNITLSSQNRNNSQDKNSSPSKGSLSPERSSETSLNKTIHGRQPLNETLPPRVEEEDLTNKTSTNTTLSPGISEDFHNAFSNRTLPEKVKDLSNADTTIHYQWLTIEINNSVINSSIKFHQAAKVLDRIKANISILNSIQSAGFILSSHNAVERLHLKNVIFVRSGPQSSGTIISLNGGGINGTKSNLVMSNVTVTGHIDKWIFLHCIHCCIDSDLLVYKDLMMTSNGLFLSSVEAHFKRIELDNVQLSSTFFIISSKSVVNVKDVFSVRHSTFRGGPILHADLLSVVILKMFQGMIVCLFNF